MIHMKGAEAAVPETNKIGKLFGLIYLVSPTGTVNQIQYRNLRIHGTSGGYQP